VQGECGNRLRLLRVVVNFRRNLFPIPEAVSIVLDLSLSREGAGKTYTQRSFGFAIYQSIYAHSW
jgi:hypothetical protein